MSKDSPCSLSSLLEGQAPFFFLRLCEHVVEFTYFFRNLFADYQAFLRSLYFFSFPSISAASTRSLGAVI